MDIKKCIGCKHLIKIDTDDEIPKDLWYCKYMAIHFNEESEVECSLKEDNENFILMTSWK